MPIDYSNWKKIDVSDDEDDTLKHVDTPSLFRWRHQSRLEKMAEAKRASDEVKRKHEKVQGELADVRKRLDENPEMELDERQKLFTQLQELEKQEKEVQGKEKELDKEEKSRPWNVDTISRTGFTKTRINKAPSVSAPPPQFQALPPVYKKAVLEKFYVANKFLIRKFGTLRNLDESEALLLKYPQLCCDETATCLASECLNLEMQGEHEKMEQLAEQATVMNYVLELATQLKCPPGNPKLISTVIGRLRKAKDGHRDAYDMFKSDVRDFIEIVTERMQENKDELIKKKEELLKEEERKRRMGPGGLDPVEVMQSLPEEMRRAFETKDLPALERLALEMPEDEFSKHFQRCVDSGLWVPGGGNRGEPSPTTDQVRQDGEPSNEAVQSPVAKSYAEDDAVADVDGKQPDVPSVDGDDKKHDQSMN